MEGLELERKRAICTKAALGPGVRKCHVHVFNLFRSDVLSERRREGVKANISKSGRIFLLFVRVISNIKHFSLTNKVFPCSVQETQEEGHGDSGAFQLAETGGANMAPKSGELSGSISRIDGALVLLAS